MIGCGTGPNKGYKYPSPEEVEADLKLIAQANANTILVYDAPGYELDIAQKHDLMVLAASHSHGRQNSSGSIMVYW